jgi:general secretion pathway protein G
MRHQHKKQQSGFTMIELMVVIVILGILATVVVPKIMGNPDKARVVKAKQDVRALESALNLYRLDNFTYPTTDQGLDALINKPEGEEVRNWKQGGYMSRMPQDPWGNDYLYLSPGQHGNIDIYSLGADSQPEGEGANADVGNWDLK